MAGNVYYTTMVQHKKNGKVYMAQAYHDTPQNKVKLTDAGGHSKIVKLETIFRNYTEIKGDVQHA